MKQNDHVLNASAMNMITNFESHSLGITTSTGKAIKDLLSNEAQLGASHLQDDMEDDCKENQGHREGNIRRMKETGESDKNFIQSSIKEASLKYSGRTADVVLGHIQSHRLSKSHEKCKTLIRKVAPTDKLWDGCLQLNFSVTVSAVAFFKSGEKMPGVKWPESVEVKGKVKLDAFEKYIQDLPRSRNRGLMVVSLRWKEGSSKLGLAGMKKVAKRYKEGERVGFAQLSPGIDLYVCPRTETIITILAKHGFFKGKTAIEENRDSMIGCVVWRRNQINLNSVEPKSERCTHQVAVSKVSPIHLPSESFESSGKIFTALDAKQKDRIERDKNLSKSPLGVHNFPTSCNALTSQSTPSILPSVPAQPETSHPDPEYQQVSMEQSLKLESHVDKSGEEQQDLKFKLQRPVLVLPSDATKQPSPIADSEDLPEFDFGTSCGIISQAVTNRALDSLTVDKNLPDKGFRHMDGFLPLTVPTLNSWPTLHKRRLENLSHQGLSSDDDTEKMPPQKKVCRHDNMSMLPLVLGRQSKAMRKPYSTPVAPPAKNLFDDDDDDMPEWCPPDGNLEKQSILVTNQSSNFPIHSKEPKLIHPVQSAAAQNPFSSSACVAADHPPFSTQTTHFAFHALHDPVFTGKHAQTRPTDLYVAKGPTSSMEINCIQPFRSNSCLVNGKLPINREVWKGWMS